MVLRNGPDGYGVVTKTLHWLTVLLVATQFVVGYSMDADDGGGRGRGRGRGGGSGRGRGGDGEEGYELVGLLPVHVALGITILVVAILRVGWRLGTDLPPWAAQLSVAHQGIITWTERVLLLMLFVVPATGLALVLGKDDDLLGLHIAAHVVFFAALAAHVGMVLGKRLLPRML
ncbi:MAG TPA: cytochrome b/b6 domain-containing protein [Marmoricola sp.]